MIAHGMRRCYMTRHGGIWHCRRLGGRPPQRHDVVPGRRGTPNGWLTGACGGARGGKGVDAHAAGAHAWGYLEMRRAAVPDRITHPLSSLLFTILFPSPCDPRQSRVRAGLFYVNRIPIRLSKLQMTFGICWGVMISAAKYQLHATDAIHRCYPPIRVCNSLHPI